MKHVKSLLMIQIFAMMALIQPSAQAADVTLG